MKQDLWIANSSLVLMFVLTLMAYEFLQQEPPPWRPPRELLVVEVEKKPEPVKTTTPSWEKIFQEDIFGTFVAPIVKAEKQSFVTPIPEIKAPVIPQPPEVKKQEFVPALTITLRGIIVGSDESRNVAMIADETNKEGMYHLGEKIKDAQIIKIAHNRVVLLRANGQQEIFYLRKDDVPIDQPPEEKWKYIVKKIDDQNFTVDPDEFVKEVDTLGFFIDQASVVGTAYSEGKPLGIRIGKVDKSSISTALGLVENDIITTVNDINLAEAKNRIQAYDAVTQLPIGQIIKVGIKRADKDVLLSYKLAKIERPKKSVFPGAKTEGPKAPGDQLKMSRLQQREQTVREFDKLHPDEQKHQQAMMEIRRRILENLQHRFQHNR